MNIIIEQIFAGDEILAVLAAFDASFPRPISARVGSLRAHAQKLAGHAIVAVARQSDRILGFTAFYANDAKTSVAFLSHLAVSDECRGQGIGLELMRWSMRTAKGSGMSAMELEVDNNNPSAIAFYRTLGFTVTGPASPVSSRMSTSSL